MPVASHPPPIRSRRQLSAASRQSQPTVARRQLPTQRVGPSPLSGSARSVFNLAGPAAPLSHGHSTVACLAGTTCVPVRRARPRPIHMTSRTPQSGRPHSMGHVFAQQRRASTSTPKRPRDPAVRQVSLSPPTRGATSRATLTCLLKRKPDGGQGPETSQASTPPHDASQETRRSASHRQRRTAPSLPQKGGPHRATGHQRPSSPGRQYRAGPDRRDDAQLARGRYSKPKEQATFEDRVAATSSASVPSCAGERSPDAAPGLHRTASSSRRCTPQGRKRERPHVRRRHSSLLEGVGKSKVSWPGVTVRQCTPNACSTPAHAKFPADDIEHGPNVSGHDSQADNKHARSPHSIKA